MPPFRLRRVRPWAGWVAPILGFCLAYQSALADTGAEAGPAPVAAPSLTVAQLRARYPGAKLVQVDAATFAALSNRYGTPGPLAAAPGSAPSAAPDSAPSAAPGRRPCVADYLHPDSCLAKAAAPADSAARADSLESARARRPAAPDGAGAGDDTGTVARDRTVGYAAQFMADLDKGGGSSKDWDKVAVVIFVVVGFFVVAVMALSGLPVLYDFIANRGHRPVWSELGLGYTYTVRSFDTRDGSLYQSSHLAGVRYALGLRGDWADIALAAEAGYLDLSFRGGPIPLDLRGGYGLLGPAIRLGAGHRADVEAEFLNGTSSHRSVGWISRARVSVGGMVGPHARVGAHLGSLFYDLHPLDGMVVEGGALNRDFSLLLGMDLAWRF